MCAAFVILVLYSIGWGYTRIGIGFLGVICAFSHQLLISGGTRKAGFLVCWSIYFWKRQLDDSRNKFAEICHIYFLWDMSYLTFRKYFFSLFRIVYQKLQIVLRVKSVFNIKKYRAFSHIYFNKSKNPIIVTGGFGLWVMGYLKLWPNIVLQ